MTKNIGDSYSGTHSTHCQEMPMVVGLLVCKNHPFPSCSYSCFIIVASLIPTLPISPSAHTLSNISFTSGLQNTNPSVSHRSFKNYLSTIKSHVPRSSIYPLLPPLHDFHVLVFWLGFTPAHVLWPYRHALHLVWFHPLFLLPFCLFHHHPPSPLLFHPRVYPLIADLPSSLQSSFVPHRSSEASEEYRTVRDTKSEWVVERVGTDRLNLWQQPEGGRRRKRDWRSTRTPR